MTTISVRNVIMYGAAFIVDTSSSVNIDITGISADYQLLITLVARTELILRINGNVFSDIGSGVYLLALNNGSITVYFLRNLSPNGGNFDIPDQENFFVDPPGTGRPFDPNDGPPVSPVPWIVIR